MIVPNSTQTTIGQFSTDYPTIAHFTPFTETKVEGVLHSVVLNLSFGTIIMMIMITTLVRMVLPIEILRDESPLRLGMEALQGSPHLDVENFHLSH